MDALFVARRHFCGFDSGPPSSDSETRKKAAVDCSHISGPLCTAGAITHRRAWIRICALNLINDIVAEPAVVLANQIGL